VSAPTTTTPGVSLDDSSVLATGGDQAARLRRLMERTELPAPSDDRPASPTPLKPATLGGRLGAHGWGRPGASNGRSAAAAPAPKAHAKVVAIASGKGGVGKTNLTVSLAACVSAMGARVTLLDADFGLANADVLCGVQPRGRLDEVIDGRRRLRDILVDTPAGFRLAAGATGVAKLVDAGAQTARAVVSRLERLERDSDLVLIDCAAGIGRPVLAMLLAADVPIVVATPEPTSITDAYGLIKALKIESRRAGRPVTPLLWINQARNEAEARAVYDKIAAVGARFLGTPVGMIGWTPSCPSVSDAVRRRTPVALSHPSRPAAVSVRRTAAELVARLELRTKSPGERSGFFRRLASVLGTSQKS